MNFGSIRKGICMKNPHPPHRSAARAGVARHLDVILAQPQIQAIQWVQGLGKDWPILQWVPLLRRILAAGNSVVVDVPMEELNAFMEQMPREGVFLCLGVGVEEGQDPDVIRRVERWGNA